MNKELFLKIVKAIGEDEDLCDFEYEHDGKKYGFTTAEDGKWEDDGKYSYKTETFRLIEMNEKYQTKKTFNFGISRSVSRTGSYYSDYYYQYHPVKAYEIVTEVVPEVVIPAHEEEKWNVIQ